MKVKILHLIEGAKKAEGLTVIIDVFRAFSLECYLYDMGVEEIIPVGSIEEAYHLKEQNKEYVLIGERHGEKCPGFDFGNSPSSIKPSQVSGRTVIHTTSAGTQGVVNAKNASEIITGSLVNAKAIARYILSKNPDEVSLVCMGNGGVRIAKEDELCAEYIKSLLMNEEMSQIEQRASRLQFDGGEHFFDGQKQHIFPEQDFWMCTKCNIFSFVIQIKQSSGTFSTIRIPMTTAKF